MFRVALDTSVIVAAVRSARGASRQWVRHVLAREVTLVLSTTVVLEYEAVLKRPQHMSAFDNATAADIDQFLDALCNVAEYVSPSFLWRPMLHDPDDEALVELAMNGRADALLTLNERDFEGANLLDIYIERPGPALIRMKRRMS